MNVSILKEYRKRGAAYLAAHEELRKFEEIFFNPRGPTISGLPFVPRDRDKLTALAAKHEKLMWEFRIAERRFFEISEKINNIATLLSSYTLVRLCAMRYKAGLTFEEISLRLGYSVRTIYRLHKRLLKEVAKL